MTRILGRKDAAVAVAILTAIAVFGVGGIALADTLQDTIADNGVGVTLVAGSATTGSAAIKVIGNNAAQDPDPGCNIDAGELPLKLTLNTPVGVTASPNPLTITSCGTDFPITLAAASNAVSGHVTVVVLSGPAGGGTYVNQVDIPITITQPVPTNTKPSVAVVGVTDGASYEFGTVLTPSCAVTDAQDGNSSKAAVISGALASGLGSQTATCDYTDTGGLAADTATATYSIVDSGLPTIGYVLSPAAPNGLNGWYISDVTVDFTCADSGSGIASCVGDVTLGEGANQSVTGTATDNGGNTQTATASGIDVDKSAPNAPIVSVSPAPNLDGWNRSDVVVSFASNGDNGPSGVATCTGDVLVTAETAGESIAGTCIDNAGHVSVASSVTVKLDGTAPTVNETVTVEGTAGDNGWYTSDVKVTFAATDGLSGPASQTGESTSVGEGDTVAVKSPVFSDLADNTTAIGAVTKYFKIDKTAPSAPTASVSPAPNGDGWNRTDVVVSFASNGDSGSSGVAGCTADVTVTAETAGQVVTGWCTDNAGNVSAGTPVTVKLDRAAPVVGNSVTVDGTAGTNGWYTSDVEVTFTATDGLSGPASQTGESTSVGEGDTVAVKSPVFSDLADNTTAIGAVTKYFKIDKTAPTVSLVGGPSGSYYFGSLPAAPTCQGTDGVSGISTCAITGGGTTVGQHSYTATATDNAGNTSSTSQGYTVLAWNLSGFYAPVDMNGAWNIVKGGSTVPLKFEIFAGNAEITNVAAISGFTPKSVVCPGASTAMDEIEFVTTGGTALRYDSTGGQFIQNWATPKKPGTCLTVTMTTDDGSTITANFKLK